MHACYLSSLFYFFGWPALLSAIFETLLTAALSFCRRALQNNSKSREQESLLYCLLKAAYGLLKSISREFYFLSFSVFAYIVDGVDSPGCHIPKK